MVLYGCIILGLQIGNYYATLRVYRVRGGACNTGYTLGPSGWDSGLSADCSHQSCGFFLAPNGPLSRRLHDASRVGQGIGQPSHRTAVGRTWCPQAPGPSAVIIDPAPALWRGENIGGLVMWDLQCVDTVGIRRSSGKAALWHRGRRLTSAWRNSPRCRGAVCPGARVYICVPYWLQVCKW